MKITKVLAGLYYSGATVCCCLGLGVASANATLLSVSGPNSLQGGVAAIIGAPADVNDGAAFNNAQQGFDEVQNYLLLADLNVDGGIILAGTTISSHMLFLNNQAGDHTLNEHEGVDWTFSGNIIGVMSDINGTREVASSSFLGAPGTLYPLASFDNRGLEIDDSYSFLLDVLTFNSRIRQPGDWIRVITEVSPTVPEPASMLLLGSGLLGLALRRSKKTS